jgi:hypothetical protein
MNCYYCKQPCQLTHGSVLEAERWSCNQHSHPVIFWLAADGKLDCTFKTVCKEKVYIIDWNKSSQGEFWSLSDGGKILVRAQYIPQRFTPDNIDKKLPLLLPFL